MADCSQCTAAMANVSQAVLLLMARTSRNEGLMSCGSCCIVQKLCPAGRSGNAPIVFALFSQSYRNLADSKVDTP